MDPVDHVRRVTVGSSDRSKPACRLRCFVPDVERLFHHRVLVCTGGSDSDREAARLYPLDGNLSPQIGAFRACPVKLADEPSPSASRLAAASTQGRKEAANTVGPVAENRTTDYERRHHGRDAAEFACRIGVRRGLARRVAQQSITNCDSRRLPGRLAFGTVAAGAHSWSFVLYAPPSAIGHRRLRAPGRCGRAYSDTHRRQVNSAAVDRME